MNTFRIALANIRFPSTPEESITLAEQAIAQASIERVGIICFPECFTPGYRGMGKSVPPPDPAFLERAWSAIAAAAAKASLAVVLGTEREAGVPRAGLVRYCSSRCEGQPRGRSRHRTRRRWRPVSHRAGHQPRRNDRRFQGQSPTQPLRGPYLFARFREAGLPNRSPDIRCRNLP